jgi:hypothetical protein
MPTSPQRERQPTLIADFGSPGDARAAIEALENHGIDGLEVAMLKDPGRRGRERADRRAVTHVGGRVAKGATIGAAIGAAILGLVGLVLVVAAGWPVVAVPAVMVAGIGFGAAVGAFWSVERGVGLSEDWEKTFEQPADADASVSIAIYTVDPSHIDRAREVLDDHRPTGLREPHDSGTTQ